MDYEKKYKNALEWARQVMNGETGFIRNEVEEVFPELKESEDDRIRKVLVGFFKCYKETDTCGSETFNGIPTDKILAWLEKQGGITKLSEEEQNRFAKGVLTSCALSFINYLDAHKYEGKMCVSNGECEDIENAFHNDMWDRLHRYYCKYIEKQGEQKPNYCHHEVDMSGCSEEYRKAYYDGWNNCNQQHAQLEAEQKSAWSEEDDYKIEILFCLLHNERDNYPKLSNYVQDLKKTERWLESLKERVQPQHKQEWSEEDEKELCRVIYMMEQLGLTESWSDCYIFLKSLKERIQPKQEWSKEDERNLQGIIDEIEATKNQAPDFDIEIIETYDRFLKWLKSLKDKYTWKPSEEQIIELRHVISGCSYDIEPLVELETKLKEL